jgi:hypothetical protein
MLFLASEETRWMEEDRDRDMDRDKDKDRDMDMGRDTYGCG